MSVSAKPWLAHYPPEIPSSLDYPQCALHDFLLAAYEKNPKHLAIRFLGKSLTYSEVYQSSVVLAQRLVQLGLEQGDRVSIMLPNCPQAVLSYYAVLMAGGVVVQTNPLYVERELEYQLADSGSKMIIALDLLYPRLERVQSKTDLQVIILTGIQDYLPFPKNIIYSLSQALQSKQVSPPFGAGLYAFKNLVVNRGQSDLAAPRVSKPDDLALIQYTGGTTGKPKGVMLTHHNLVVNTYQCRKWLYKATIGQERSLGVIPFFHVYGMTVVMNLTILLASTMILLPKFKVKETLKTIQKEAPSLFPGAPTIYIALLNYPHRDRYNLSSIQACISGSAPLPEEVQHKFQKLIQGKLVEGYGLSETSPVTHANLIWDRENKAGSIGIPWPDTEAIILDLESGEPLSPGEIGEIAIKGPQVMQGYWNRPQDTEASFKDGWFLTGDLGYMDEEGYFFIIDRKKDMIISSGFKVYPREVEEVLYSHPKIKECVVFGVPDSHRGQAVKVCLVKKEGVELEQQELAAYCREKLASYKVPSYYEFRQELPKNIIGKVLRRLLVEENTTKG